MHTDNKQLLEKYFAGIPSDTADKLLALEELYHYWNARVNVISRKDMDSFFMHHVLHSLSIAKVLNIKPGQTVIDIGTGGGFPGVPLAAFFPESKFILLDSIAKKLKVIDEVASSLKLTNIKTAWQRAETNTEPCDFIVSRAVTRLLPFYEFCKKYFPTGSDKGLYYIKGGDVDEEIYDLTYQYKNIQSRIFNISEMYDDDFFETKKVIHIYKP